MRPYKGLLVTLWLLAAMGVARAESVLVPFVNEAGDLALMHLIPQDDGPWRMEPLELPTIQGLKPNYISSSESRLVISRRSRHAASSKDRILEETLAWISACYNLSDVVRVLREKDYLLGLSDDCPYNSHSLAGLHRKMMRRIAESVGDRADWQSVERGANQSTARNLFAAYGVSARPQSVGVRSYPLRNTPEQRLLQVYLLNLETCEVSLVAEGTDKETRHSPTISWGRFATYSWEDLRHLRVVWSMDMTKYDRTNKDSQAFVYDIQTGRFVFESPLFYSTPHGNKVEVNRQGTAVIINRQGPMSDPDDPSVVTGPWFVEVFDLLKKSTARIEFDAEDVHFMRWLPDGDRFVFVKSTHRRTSAGGVTASSWHLGSVDGTHHEVKWKLRGLDESEPPIRSNGVWLADSSQLVSLDVRYVGMSGDLSRQLARCYLTDFDKETCTLVAEYELLVPDRLNNVEWSQAILVP